MLVRATFGRNDIFVVMPNLLSRQSLEIRNPYFEKGFCFPHSSSPSILGLNPAYIFPATIYTFISPNIAIHFKKIRLPIHSLSLLQSFDLVICINTSPLCSRDEYGPTLFLHLCLVIEFGPISICFYQDHLSTHFMNIHALVEC